MGCSLPRVALLGQSSEQTEDRGFAPHPGKGAAFAIQLLVFVLVELRPRPGLCDFPR
jgi:hypothetical protein